MAKKAKTVFVCQECGHESPRWMGQCICGAWNSMVEEKVVDTSKQDNRRRTGILSESGDISRVKPERLNSISGAQHSRWDTGISELNRVLGGGLVKGSLTLISGEPGIGKSTIIMQVAQNIAAKGKTVLYVSGEESEDQIKMRADRICTGISENVYILTETNMEAIEVACENVKPDFLIIDSIQTMYSEEIDSIPGSVSQVRACGNMIMKIGKGKNIPIFIVAHVTKSGELAGPKIVEHLVDCVLSFTGERNQELRILRSYKNRFGPTSEIGAFKMEENGLEEIENIAATFLEDGNVMEEGAVLTAIYEGSRPILLEMQALTSVANVGFARRTAIGIENQRLSMILAVLEKKAGLSMMNQDVYVNVVGGFKVDSTSVDLAVALSIYASMKNKTLDENVLVLGEIGLNGEVRSIGNCDKILIEAKRMGYKKVILPKKNYISIKKSDLSDDNFQIRGVTKVVEALRLFSAL